MLLSRYASRRDSALSVQKRSMSSTALQKIAYHTARKATLEPIKDANDTKSAKNSEEPIDEMGIPKVLMTVEIVHQKHHKDIELPDVPPIPSSISDAAFGIIEEKLKLCSVLCDFTDPDADRRAKSIKNAALKELANVFTSPTNIKLLTPEIIDSFFKMIMKNLTRGLPAIPKKWLCWNDEPQMMDIAWPHLSSVYVLLTGFQQICPQDSHFQDRKIIMQLLDLVKAPDICERDEIVKFFSFYLNTFPENEEMILKRMSSMLFEYREGRNDPFCVNPILRIFIERFKMMKEMNAMYLDLLHNSVMPLVACQHFFSFFFLLTEIYDIFIALDQELAVTLIHRVMKCWPEAKAAKQMMIINMLNFLVERVSEGSFEQMSVHLFTLYNRCAMSSHAKIVDASFQIWHNVKIIPMLMDNTKAVFPIVFTNINRTMKEHWSIRAQNSALNALKAMKDLDPFLFQELTQKDKLSKNADVVPDSSAVALHKNWASVARAAARVEKSINLAKVLAEIQVKFSTTAPATNDPKKSGSTTVLAKKPAMIRQPIVRK